MEPRALDDQATRKMARHVRDRQWRMLERIAENNPLHICWWDKNRRHRQDEEAPDDLMACSLIVGMEILHWLKAHPEWTTIGEWSEERCAVPVHITDRGLEALANRERYDMEPVEGGLVEPGWKAIPLEQ